MLHSLVDFKSDERNVVLACWEMLEDVISRQAANILVKILTNVVPCWRMLKMLRDVAKYCNHFRLQI